MSQKFENFFGKFADLQSAERKQSNISYKKIIEILMFYYTVGSIGDLFRYGYNGERLFCITFQICFTISIFYWQALLMFIIKCAFNQGKYIAGMVLPQNIDGVRSIEEPAKQFAQFFSQIISWAQEGANNQSNKN